MREAVSSLNANLDQIKIVRRTRGGTYGIPISEVEMYISELKSKDVSKKHKQKQIKWIQEFLRILPTTGGDSEPLYVENPEPTYVVSARIIEDYLEHLDSLKGRYGQNLGYKAKMDRISTVRRFLRELGVDDREIIGRLKMLEDELRRKWKTHIAMNPKTVTKEDVDSLFNALEAAYEDEEIGEEQYCKALAFLLLLATTGRRKEEIARAHIEWFDFEANIMKLPHSVTKVGRQLKETEGFEVIPLHPETAACLKMYARKFGHLIKANDGYLFAVPTRKAENPTFWDAMIKKHPRLRVQLRYSPGTLTPKLLRKFFIQHWYEKNGNELILKKIVGHSPTVVHDLHYARGIRPEKVIEEYQKVLGKTSFLTKKQRAMVARYLPRKRGKKRRKRRK
ncbi:hypothetical protein APY94_00170 [Thermococcus celericrescens]|uniref:Tyr recombinase domain-containing protein n=1 Tax=Thermococcus celericrescens TaxID=227598 RepID=A0A100XZX3_9EURY|nr:tyrosine-type recombinase/integrase [Thermococcus celericrescens]KUH34826.1 hypothetical protein APY94_00170 [Thermococcus celericrescens]